jgi:hypothetical protein
MLFYLEKWSPLRLCMISSLVLWLPGRRIMEITNNQLHQLRLWGMAKTLPMRLQESGQEKWSYSEFLNGLLLDEIRFREQKRQCKKAASPQSIVHMGLVSRGKS